MSTEAKGIEAVRNVFQEELTKLKESLSKVEQPTPTQEEDLHTVEQFLEHVDSCDKDDCEIHQKMDNVSKEWLVRGINLGKQL